ncbi:cytochrome b [Paraburkholderia acidipaludis]|uniref:cytochrome b n=1 Tax=Paraburkholderia acidipaludis TaxID=660537 RepID=UPI000487470B|nr:cytochrome b [Paraburkholderia acidipaludis]
MHTTIRYNTVARLLHWLVAALVAGQFVLGWSMPDVRHDTQPVGLIAWHITAGTALLAAMIFRLLWRVTHRPPADDLAPVLRAISLATHWALYTLLFVVPILGWINASSRAWQIGLFRVIPLPALSPVGWSFGRAMGDVHGFLAWVLFILIFVHTAAALLHRYVLRDRVMQRMALW